MQNATAPHHWLSLPEDCRAGDPRRSQPYSLSGCSVNRRTGGARRPLSHQAFIRSKDSRMRTLDDFDFKVSPVSMPQIRELAEGSYLDRAEPVLFLSDTGTGKT